MQEQKNRSRRGEPEDLEEIDIPEPREFDMDALLDEIDDVLEENAEEFVNSYIQKGGE